MYILGIVLQIMLLMYFTRVIDTDINNHEWWLNKSYV